MTALSVRWLNSAYTQAASLNKVNAWSKQRFDDFYALPPDAIDTVFIGSSHSYCTFAPEILDPRLGIESYQFGMPLQHPDSTYYTLLEIFKTQKPKLVVMELYWGVTAEDFEVKQAEALFQAMGKPEVRDDYIKQVFPWNEKIKYQIPFIRFQADYLAFLNSKIMDYAKSAFGVSSKALVQEGVERYSYRGFMYSDYQMLPGEFDETNQFKGFDGKNFEMSKVQRDYVKKAAELARENQAVFVLVTAPISKVSLNFIKNYQLVNSGMAALAEELDAPYMDFNMASGVFEDANFRDDAHLNYSGAVIANEMFAVWLEENVF
jgi:hypothetical protein